MGYLSRTAVAVVSGAVLLGNPSPAMARQQPASGEQSPGGSGGAAGERQSAEARAIREELERLRAEFVAIRRQYDERLFALEQRLGQIGGGPLVVEAPPEGPPVPAEPAEPAEMGEVVETAVPEEQVPLPAGASSSNVFNPDIAVIGNFIGTGGRNVLNDESSLVLEEVEAAFQAVVDPYARADFFLAVGEEGLEVEEGYVTFSALPANLLLKAGKLRAQFGKINTLHTHRVPTADRPLVTGNLVGGEEGLSDSGLSLAYLIDNPYVFLEATGEVFAGTSEVFGTSKRSRLNYLGRLRAYRDLTEDKNLDVGASFAFGPTEGVLPEDVLELAPEGATFGRRIIGIDATFRYRPLRRAIYQRLNLSTELVWSRQDLPHGAMATAFGFYGLGEYQFARRWYAGARFDRSGRVLDGSMVDYGGSVFVTFWPTEFSQVRTQYRYTSFAEGVTANEVLLQLNFSIGAHGVHVF